MNIDWSKMKRGEDIAAEKLAKIKADAEAEIIAEAREQVLKDLVDQVVAGKLDAIRAAKTPKAVEVALTTVKLTK